MIFTTWLYGLFLIVVVAVFWLVPPRLRPWWLLAAGMVFYTNYHPPHVGLVLAMTLLVYGLARSAGHVARAPGRALLGVGILLSLGLLGYYKYTGFVTTTLVEMGVAPESIITGAVAERVPLAISFFVFEYVHYLIEIRRGTIVPGSVRDFLLFIFFFPTLVAGPIKRFNDFQPQIGAQTRFDAAEANAGMQRIVVGLAKKFLVADAVQRLAAPIWDDPLYQSTGMLWLGVYAYAIQILFDFSGYSDIAIGSAQLLGFHVPENFAYPYLQPNLARFWRCWHMSLTSWITDYVYIPLGGNRHGLLRAQGNRLVAMAICGLWHGAAGHFVLWGIYHGLGLNAYQLWRRVRPRLPLPVSFGWPGRIVATVFTFHFVCIGWVLFVVDATTAQGVIWKLLGAE
ncbi:MAG TPA: MBOAT family O-acyltransferase [Candidatus Binatia bacterium]|jgi:alginate O-acetyltransferase complex protein AlgI|nr:MBOAT family O-acyltransferase [Candidatus Binatia bacterium]